VRNLIIILLRFKDFLVYFLLSCVCIWCAVKFDHIQRVNWLHASNSVGGGINKVSSNVNGYFLLKSENNALASSNSILMAEIERLRQNNVLLWDSLYQMKSTLKADSNYWKDSTRKKTAILLDESYNTRYISCRVVYNNVIGSDNFITIDKGLLDGIQVGNGVLTGRGIIGKVVSTARHYSLVKSVLHVRNAVSAKIKNSNELGSCQWDGTSPKYTYLKEIPRHTKVVKGDTVLTTEYNSVYPHGHPIGRIVEVSVDEDQPFWKIKVELFEKMSRLNHCFVYQNYGFEEKNQLTAKKDSIY
jgi:rod shape-determining protein MreC